jgi:hypothetical protein
VNVAPELPRPELLGAEHVVDGFDCGEPDINRFLRDDARAHAEAGFSQTWVIARPEDKLVLGFVALSAASQPVKVKIQGKTKPLLSGMLATCPYPAAPVLLLGQLGRRKELAKSGIGARLLIFAIFKTVELAKQVGVSGLVLDALTDDLLGYYRKAKFERLPYPDKRVRRMLLTMADAKATFAEMAG